MKQHDLLSRDFEILFVRHAQSHGNVGLAEAAFHPDDPSLTTEGLAQAQALSRRFSAGDLQAIYASTLIRTCQTVQPTAQKLGLAIEVLPELMEVDTAVPGTALSHITRLAPNAYNSACRVLTQSVGLSFKNETSAHCAERARYALSVIAGNAAAGDKILVATHGAFFGYLLRCALGLSLPEPFAWEVTNCAITTIRFRKDDIPILLGSNDTSHLSFYIN